MSKLIKTLILFIGIILTVPYAYGQDVPLGTGAKSRIEIKIGGQTFYSKTCIIGGTEGRPTDIVFPRDFLLDGSNPSCSGP